MSESREYTITRAIILLVLIAEIVISIKILLCDTGFGFSSYFPFNKYLFGILAGIFGLFLRNCYWLFGDHSESKGKNLWLTYLLQYQFFVILSSILISSVLLLSDKIGASPYLFFTLALPLNIYIGLETYRALDLIKDIIRKNV